MSRCFGVTGLLGYWVTGDAGVAASGAAPSNPATQQPSNPSRCSGVAASGAAPSNPATQQPSNPSPIRSLAALAIIFLATTASAATMGDPARGQLLFVSKRCVECHAVRGAGGRIGPDLGRSAVKGSFYEIVAAMWNHVPTMDEKMKELRLMRPQFDAGELSDLLAFLYFLNYFDERGDARSGKSLFAEKHCIECHAVGKEGGRTGPRLDTLPRGMPPLQIAQDLWNHGPVMVPAMRARKLEVPTFRGNEIIDLFAYLRTQGQRRSARAFKSAGDPVKGKAIFSSKGCATCHSVYGRGGGAIGPDLG